MNCKPGDLAMVVSSDFTENLGAMLRVVSLDPEGDWIFEDATRPLRLEDKYAPCGFCYASHSKDGCAPDEWCVVLDKNLLPIRPGDLEDETPTVRELEAA